VRRLLIVTLPVIATLLLATGCARSSALGRPPADRDVVLGVSSAPGLGRFVTVDGWTVYMYPPDRQRSVTCTQAGDCRQAWPPLFVPTGHRVVAGPGVQADLIGTMPGDGGKVVTYNHWPLYYYIGDRKAGQVNGQNQGFNWFVIRPTGIPNKSDMGSPTG
jgi:predicted lipoprotein with Yx(FWY)xxD motif